MYVSLYMKKLSVFNDNIKKHTKFEVTQTIKLSYTLFINYFFNIIHKADN
jgi:hypothetical protein